jgi:hypothetical protein
LHRIGRPSGIERIQALSSKVIAWSMSGLL